MKAKLALITGGGGDLALELRDQLLAAGYEVRSPLYSELDVTDAKTVEQYMQNCERIDLLVNNAGLTRDARLQRLDEAAWDEVLGVNAKGAFLCAKCALRKMIRQRSGHVLNIGSYSALRPPVGQANYAAAKAALIGLTQSLAAEYGDRGVRVNCVLPGFLETRMTSCLSDSARAQALQKHMLGRFNQLADAARFIVFLDTMKGVSGQVFQLDSRLSSWC